MPIPLSRDVYEQLEAAYGHMADAGYRPSAHGDGFGKITGPLNLVKEVRAYAERWWEEEDRKRFWIGTTWPTNRIPLVLVIEAGRLLCGTKDNKLALRLLRKANVLLENERRHSSKNGGKAGQLADSPEGPSWKEQEMQFALRANIQQLEPGLKIIDGGKERTVRSGRVDILAEDRDGTVVVIELKAAEADRHAVGQILSYMGELQSTGKPIRGILIAASFSQRCQAAASSVSNLQLRNYRINIAFESQAS